MSQESWDAAERGRGDCRGRTRRRGEVERGKGRGRRQRHLRGVVAVDTEQRRSIHMDGRCVIHHLIRSAALLLFTGHSSLSDLSVPSISHDGRCAVHTIQHSTVTRLGATGTAAAGFSYTHATGGSVGWQRLRLPS